MKLKSEEKINSGFYTKSFLGCSSTATSRYDEELQIVRRINLIPKDAHGGLINSGLFIDISLSFF